MNRKDDNPISDEELLMIYFKETKQQRIEDCLNDSDACQRLDQLEIEMKAIEQAQNKTDEQMHLPDNYGQQLWHQIADQLKPVETQATSAKTSWLDQLKSMMLMPQYSLASLVLVTGLVLVAFYAGQKHNNTASGIDLQEQLLAQNIQLHLTQSEIFLTQVSNDNGTQQFATQATAQRLLSSNRIFKQALANHDGQFTQQLLQDLEPILVEYSNRPQSTGGTEQNHGQQPQANWVNDESFDLPKNLMFQIKTMKQQLAHENDII